MKHIKTIRDFLTFALIAIFAIMGVWKSAELITNNAYKQATEQAQYMLIFKNAKELNRAAKALNPTEGNDTITNHNRQNQTK